MYSIVIDGRLYAVCKANRAEKEIEIDGTRYPVKEMKSPFERVPKRECYWCVNSWGEVSREEETGEWMCEKRYRAGNYCSSAALLEQLAMKEGLNRLLWKASIEAGRKNPWEKGEVSGHYTIIRRGNEFDAVDTGDEVYGAVYFPTIDSAREAIENVVRPYIAAHPGFEW